jgi:hypothetical protein
VIQRAGIIPLDGPWLARRLVTLDRAGIHGQDADFIVMQELSRGTLNHAAAAGFSDVTAELRRAGWPRKHTTLMPGVAMARLEWLTTSGEIVSDLPPCRVSMLSDWEPAIELNGGEVRALRQIYSWPWRLWSSFLQPSLAPREPVVTLIDAPRLTRLLSQPALREAVESDIHYLVRYIEESGRFYPEVVDADFQLLRYRTPSAELVGLRVDAFDSATTTWSPVTEVGFERGSPRRVVTKSKTDNVALMLMLDPLIAGILSWGTNTSPLRQGDGGVK